MLLITRMIQICSFMTTSLCFDRHVARRKTVLVAHLRTAHVLHSNFSNPYASRRRRQAQRILELHRIGRIFIAAHTSDNTPSAMRGKLLKDYSLHKAKAKKPFSSHQQDRLHVSQGGPVAAPPKHSPMMRERHLVTPLKRNSCSASRSPFASSACPRTVRGHSVAHVDVHKVTCSAVLRAQTQLEPV